MFSSSNQSYLSKTVKPEEFTVIYNRLKEGEECLSVYGITLLAKFSEETEKFWRKFEHRCFACLVQNESSDIVFKIVDFQSQYTEEPVHIILDLKMQSAFHVHMEEGNVFSFSGNKYTLGLTFCSPADDIHNFVSVINNIVPRRRNRNLYKKKVDEAVKLIKDTDVKNWLKIHGTTFPFLLRKLRLMKSAKRHTNWIVHKQLPVKNEFFKRNDYVERDRESSGFSSNHDSFESDSEPETRELTLREQILHHHQINGRRISKLYAEISDPTVIFQLQETRKRTPGTLNETFVLGRF